LTFLKLTLRPPFKIVHAIFLKYNFKCSCHSEEETGSRKARFDKYKYRLYLGIGFTCTWNFSRLYSLLVAWATKVVKRLESNNLLTANFHHFIRKNWKEPVVIFSFSAFEKVNSTFCIQKATVLKQLEYNNCETLLR
jgi:hypothetical protein